MERLIIQFGRSKVILSFIVAIGMVVGYLSYSQADDPTLSLINEESVIKRDDLESFKSFSVDFTIFDDERYKDLEIFGENPVIPDVTGERINPFAPI